MPLEPSVPARANVYEGNGQLSVAMPIPGAHREHVRVSLGPTVLRVQADCKYPQESQHYHRRDWQVGSWQAEVALPRGVDPAAGRATLNLGVLVVMAPLSESGAGEHDVNVV
jgi:HSP20 family molecular chaperone IbpA